VPYSPTVRASCLSPLLVLTLACTDGTATEGGGADAGAPVDASSPTDSGAADAGMETLVGRWEGPTFPPGTEPPAFESTTTRWDFDSDGTAARTEILVYRPGGAAISGCTETIGFVDFVWTATATGPGAGDLTVRGGRGERVRRCPDPSRDETVPLAGDLHMVGGYVITGRRLELTLNGSAAQLERP
jgi:hypothetical protein